MLVPNALSQVFNERIQVCRICVVRRVEDVISLSECTPPPSQSFGKMREKYAGKCVLFGE